MSSLTEIIESVVKSESLINLEESVVRELRAVFSTVVSNFLEEMDEQLSQNISDKCINKQERTINFLFGTVTFKRRYYERSDGVKYFALDQQLKLEDRKRFSPYFTSVMAQLGQMTTFKNTAEIINLVAQADVSPDKVMRSVRAASKVVKSERIQVNEAVLEKQKPEYLMVEGDGVMVKVRKKKKTIKTTVHHYRIYEGVEVVKKRRKLINSVDFAGVNGDDVRRRLIEYVQNHFDLKNTVVLAGSDAGPGYEPETMLEITHEMGAKKQEFILDRYHLLQKIDQCLGFLNPLAKKAIKAVQKYDEAAVNMVLDTHESNLNPDDAKKLDDLERLRAYLKRNWNYIPHPRERGYKTAPKLGSAESSHRSYTYRLKKQGKSWSKEGLNAMLLLIESRINGHLWTRMVNGYQKLNELDVPVSVERVEKRIKRSVTQKSAPHVGVKQGTINITRIKSSAMGKLASAFSG